MTKTFSFVRTLSALLSMLAFTGCFYDEGLYEALPEDTVVSYALDIQPIFDKNCTLCHPLISPVPDLTGDKSYDAITLDNYVVSKDLEASVLYQRLTGKPSVMPPSGSLPQIEIDLVKTWIEQGALNN